MNLKSPISFFIISCLFFTATVAGQDTLSLDKQLRQYLQKDFFRVSMLIQSEGRFALQNDDFQDGRTFRARNARLSLSGNLDGGFFYRFFVDIAPQPSLLDAFLGYKVDSWFRISVGAMKPSQTLDYIPNPGEHNFVDRAEITGLLVGSREIGIAAEGDLGSFYYYLGAFNGSGLLSNNNNEFYTIGRLQYNPIEFLQLAVSGSHGNSEGIISGSRGPLLSGLRTIAGADFEFDNDRLYFAAEYSHGMLETVDFPDETEIIRGYYVSGGIRLSEKIMLFSRWQNWNYKLLETSESKLTLGSNIQFTELFSLMFNFDAYIPQQSDNLYGLSAIFQMQF